MSHHRVGPPSWARLPADDMAGIKTYATPRALPAVLRFEEGEIPRCRCGWTALAAPTPSEIRIIACTIFDLTAAEVCEIEVVDCQRCHARFRQAAGPDLGRLGLFNYNNTRIATHRLLNNFSATFTKLATPFDAYVEVRVREYMESESATPFMSPDIFRTLWFSFVRLQVNEHAFECSICGPDPPVIVADGISAGFDLKQLRQGLRPPTAVDDASPVVEDVIRHDPTALISDAKVRKLAIRLVRWRKALRQTFVDDLRQRLPQQTSGENESDTDSSDEDDASSDEDPIDAEAEDERATRAHTEAQAKASRDELAKARSNMKAVAGAARNIASKKRKAGAARTGAEDAGRQALATLFLAHMNLEGTKQEHYLYWSLFEQVSRSI